MAPPTKAKVRKSKGVAALNPHSKRIVRAGSKRLATPLTVNQSIDEDVAVPIQEDFSQNLEMVMKVVTDLSTHVAANEVCQRQGEASSTTSPPTNLPTWRARHQGAPIHPHPDVPDEVQRSVAEGMPTLVPPLKGTHLMMRSSRLLDGGSISSPAFTGLGPPQSSAK